jgi:undecaprenyl-diphosphatase
MTALPSLLAFLRRHVWSLSLSLFAGICFLQLSSEIREGELAPFDTTASAAIAHWRGSVDSGMYCLTYIGTGQILTTLTAVLAAGLFMRSRSREAVYLLLCASSTFALNLAMKGLFQRPRPGPAALYLLAEPSSFSFPSGHAMCSAGIFASLAVIAQVVGWPRRWSRPVALGCALLFVGIGVSRIYFGVHFASDVVGGQLASIACVSALTGWFYPRLLPGEHAETPAPSVR